MTDSLVDARTGLLTSVGPQPRDPGMPAAWLGYGATVSRIDRVANWRADGFGFGATIGDPRAARAAAIGEAVERYCGNAIPARLLRGSFDELTAGGTDALDPAAFALYSSGQYAQAGFPFQPFGRDLTVEWAVGSDLATGADVLVPASQVYLDYRHGVRASEPALHSLCYSGIAAGATRRDAERNAVEELFERDACTVWWASGASTVELDDGGHVVGSLGRPGSGSRLTVRLLRIPTDLPAPVVAAFVEDHGDGGPLLAFGSACRADARTAATKALVEAMGLLQLTRQLADPASEVWRAVTQGHIEGHVFLPFRADRHYLDDVDPQYHRLTDLPPVAQLYLDTRMHSGALDRLRPPTARPIDSVPPVSGSDPLSSYVEHLSGSGLRVVSVDVTTDDVRASGITVVRVVVPGLVGNAPPAFPLRGSERYFTVPAALGWDNRPLSVDDLLTQPIPLA